MRARNWFLAHGGSYDELTGNLICSDGLRIPRKNWKKIVKEIKEGKRQFTPDRKGKRADHVQVQVGANQVQVQARKDQTFLSFDNRPNNRSHPSGCYPRMFPLGCRGKVWK
jgi:hypothetical protein